MSDSVCFLWLWIWLMRSVEHSKRKANGWGGGTVWTMTLATSFGPVTSRKENCESIWRCFRLAGSLTYCVSVGWERTSNLTLLHPRSKASRSGSNSFWACWPRQCPCYWKSTALGVSNLQSKQFKSNFSGSDVTVHLSKVRNNVCF